VGHGASKVRVSREKGVFVAADEVTTAKPTTESLQTSQNAHPRRNSGFRVCEQEGVWDRYIIYIDYFARALKRPRKKMIENQIPICLPLFLEASRPRQSMRNYGKIRQKNKTNVKSEQHTNEGKILTFRGNVEEDLHWKCGCLHANLPCRNSTALRLNIWHEKHYAQKHATQNGHVGNPPVDDGGSSRKRERRDRMQKSGSSMKMVGREGETHHQEQRGKRRENEARTEVPGCCECREI